jgi:pimeloyl-ACP methyl ester carboxylesterase
MAPDKPGNLAVLDLKLNGDAITAEVERYDPESWSGSLRVLWHASEAPRGGEWNTAGKGVVFVAAPPEVRPQRYPASVPGRYPGPFSWTNDVGDLGLMLVVVLPPGYVLANANPAEPLPPFESKPFNGRVALYWFIPLPPLRRAQVSWTIEPLEGDLGAHCDALNGTLLEARRSEPKRAQPPVALPWVISLHGIRTRGKWQKDLTPALNRAGFAHTPSEFGFFRAAQLLWSPSRRRKVEWFRDEYARVAERADRPSVIAHSLGTYLVATALRKYPEVKFDHVILCGSLVPAEYPWTTVMREDKARRVLNDVGKQDSWAYVARYFIADAGDSGVRGFTDEAEGAVLQRRHPEFRHSDFFYSLNYERNWIPFLRGLEPGAGPIEVGSHWNWRVWVVRVILLLTVIGALAGAFLWFR